MISFIIIPIYHEFSPHIVAFQILKVSNDAIKETISKLQDSMKMYKENMRSEIAKLDCLSTDRLLNINYMYT